MASRLEEEQRGFVQGRFIVDNLVLYKEAKHWAYKERKEVASLQLDFAKAFYRLKWFFLDVVLQARGFGRTCELGLRSFARMRGLK